MPPRADSSHLPYFAFTAIPKPKTLETFGCDDGTGHHRPFHTYSMKQAIADNDSIMGLVKEFIVEALIGDGDDEPTEQ